MTYEQRSSEDRKDTLHLVSRKGASSKGRKALRLFVLAVGMSPACPPAESDDGLDAAWPSADVSSAPVDAAVGVGADANDGGSLPFSPSNIPAPSFAGTGEVNISGEAVIEVAQDGVIKGVDGPAGAPPYRFSRVTQSDGSQLAVFTMRSLHVAQGAELAFESPLPVVLAAERDVNIQGMVRLSRPSRRGPQGGGFQPTPEGTGGGPGGGAAGGGGAYCGAGGRAVDANGNESPAATPYGAPEIVPLMGGSAGGASRGGIGGGALQIVAGAQLIVGPGGKITAPGGAGGLFNSGGGSGGAILLEAATATIHGTMAANGGGGSNFYGTEGVQNGQASATPAAGSASGGGEGSAGTTVAGGDGQPEFGAGGGAGWIRINTSSGSATLGAMAVFSPDLTTQCATQGTVAAR